MLSSSWLLRSRNRYVAPQRGKELADAGAGCQFACFRTPLNVRRSTLDVDGSRVERFLTICADASSVPA